MSSSFANLTLDIGGFTIGVKMVSIMREAPVSVVRVHDACITPIDHAQTCPHCRAKVYQPQPIDSPVRPAAASAPATAPVAPSAEPVAPAAKTAPAPVCKPPTKGRSPVPAAGGKALMPQRLIHCPNARCGKEIEGEVIETPFCTTCGIGVDVASIQPAHRGAGGRGLVLLSADQRAKLESLRMPRGIRVLQATRDMPISAALFSSVYQIVPNKGSEAAFEIFVRTAQQTGYRFIASARLKSDPQDTPTFNFEHMAVIRLDNDRRTVLMVTLHPERYIERVAVPPVNVPDALLNDMTQIMHGLNRPFGSPQTVSETPASASLVSAMSATREKRTYEVPSKQQVGTELAAVANRMKAALDEMKSSSAEKGDGNAETKRRARKKRASSDKAAST